MRLKSIALILGMSLAATSLIHSAAVACQCIGTRRGKLTVAASGSCDVRANTVHIPIELDVPKSVRPWLDAMMITTRIDGKHIWHPSPSLCMRVPLGTSWVGHGRDLVFTSCDKYGDRGLSPGEHTVTMEAALPGTRIRLRTKPARIRLACRQRPREAGGQP